MGNEYIARIIRVPATPITEDRGDDHTSSHLYYAPLLPASFSHLALFPFSFTTPLTANRTSDRNHGRLLKKKRSKQRRRRRRRRPLYMGTLYRYTVRYRYT